MEIINQIKIFGRWGWLPRWIFLIFSKNSWKICELTKYHRFTIANFYLNISWIFKISRRCFQIFISSPPFFPEPKSLTTLLKRRDHCLFLEIDSLPKLCSLLFVLISLLSISENRVSWRNNKELSCEKFINRIQENFWFSRWTTFSGFVQCRLYSIWIYFLWTKQIRYWSEIILVERLNQKFWKWNFSINYVFLVAFLKLFWLHNFCTYI